MPVLDYLEAQMTSLVCAPPRLSACRSPRWVPISLLTVLPSLPFVSQARFAVFRCFSIQMSASSPLIPQVEYLYKDLLHGVLDRIFRGTLQVTSPSPPPSPLLPSPPPSSLWPPLMLPRTLHRRAAGQWGGVLLLA